MGPEEDTEDPRAYDRCHGHGRDNGDWRASPATAETGRMTSDDIPQGQASEPAPRRPKRPKRPRAAQAPGRVWIAALGAGVAVALLALLLFPHDSMPRAEFGGDGELVGDLAASGDPDLVQCMAVARFPVDDTDAIEWAFAGTTDGDTPVGEDTPFETASVFKTFTAMTLADMVESGETSLDRTLGEVFPGIDFTDEAIADATLEQIANHHSGLSQGAVGAPRSEEHTSVLQSRGHLVCRLLLEKK